VGSNPTLGAKIVVRFRLSGLRPDEGSCPLFSGGFSASIVMRDTNTDLSSDYRFVHGPATSDSDPSPPVEKWAVVGRNLNPQGWRSSLRLGTHDLRERAQTSTSDCFQHVLNVGGSIGASPTDYSSRVREFSVLEHEPPSVSFHGRSPASFHLGNSARASQSGILQIWAGVALLVFVEQICSPLPFLASEVLGMISRPARLLYPAYYFVPSRRL